MHYHHEWSSSFFILRRTLSRPDRDMRFPWPCEAGWLVSILPGYRGVTKLYSTPLRRRLTPRDARFHTSPQQLRLLWLVAMKLM